MQSEEEALQRALEMSLAESARGSAQPPRYSWGIRCHPRARLACI